MKGGRVVSIYGFLLFLLPLRCLYPDGEYLKQLVTVRCLCRSYFEFGFKQFGEKKSVLPCSTLPTLTNIRCLAQPVNNAYGIAVDYPLSCWRWNNTIAPSYHSNACLVYIPANYPIFFRRPRIRRYRCPSAYYSNTSASFHPFLIGDLVFKLNPGHKGIPVIVSTRSSHNHETQLSSSSRNISNLISVRRYSALAPIVADKHLSLCLLNARSVKNKTADLCDYICDCKADLVAITETWLTTDDAAVRAELCPVGYKISDRPRTGRRGGGVALIYRDSLSVRRIDAGGKESFEYSEWTISSPSLNLRLVLLYRPPYSADHRVSTNDFFTEFSTYLESILLSKEHVVIAGDFNIHVYVPHDPDSLKLLDLLQSVGLQQHITEPTQIQGHTLDLAITCSSDNILNKVPEVHRFISDHASVYCTIHPDRPCMTTENVVCRKLKSVDLESLKRDLSDSLLCSDPPDLQLYLHSEDPCDLDAIVRRYNTTLSKVIDCHAPLKTKTVNVRPAVPWYNDEIKVAKRLRRKAERTWRRTRSVSDLNIFKSHRNRMTYLMNQARQAFYTNFIDENSTGHKRLFRATKQLLAKKKEFRFLIIRTNKN